VTPPWLDPAHAPEREALGFASERLARGELARRADAMAAGLERAGAGPGDVVAVLLSGSPAWAAVVHGLDRLGAILLPLNARLTPRELVHPLRDSGTRWLVHDDSPLASLAEDAAREAAGISLLPVDALARAGERAQQSGAGLQALLYTSGTTGEPKGAWLAAGALRASAAASAEHLGVRDDDRWLACLPLFHVGGLSILLRAARDATGVLLHDGFEAAAVSDALDRGGVSHVSLVPTMLERLLAARAGRPAPAGLRCVLLGGGPAAAATLEEAADLGWPLAPTYGLTEAASQVATALPSGSREPLRDGLPALPGTALRIVREDGEEAAPGEAGEIQVKGPTLMRGYWNRPEETARTLVSGWLRTGDLGVLDDRGHLHVHDRRSDLIVSGGENVYPAEVEAVLAGHPDLAEAGVRGVPDAEFGSRPVAWCVARADEAPDPAALDRYCRERLAGYKVPVRFHRVAALPRNASGKLQRQRLEEP